MPRYVYALKYAEGVIISDTLYADEIETVVLLDQSELGNVPGQRILYRIFLERIQVKYGPSF